MTRSTCVPNTATLHSRQATHGNAKTRFSINVHHPGTRCLAQNASSSCLHPCHRWNHRSRFCLQGGKYHDGVIGVSRPLIHFTHNVKFVYEPHIAPRIEQWAEEFVAQRQARRRQRAGAALVSSQHDLTDENIQSQRRRTKHSDSGDEDNEERQSIELEHLIAKEVREWRSEVNRSHSHKLRHRNNAGASSSRDVLDQASPSILCFFSQVDI